MSLKNTKDYKIMDNQMNYLDGAVPRMPRPQVQIFMPGLRIHHILTGGSGSLGYGSTWKCIIIENVKAGNFSIMLLIIEFRDYRVNYNKTGQ